VSSESEIQRAILDALLACGAFAFRTNSSRGAIKVRGGWVTLCPSGTPDIYVLVPPHGRSLWLEVKTATGEERESQIAWSTDARRRGALVETVRSPQEAVAAYTAAVRASMRGNAA
jgi:hypothetical protein